MTEPAPQRPLVQQPRPLPVFILADVSGSMDGEKIKVLNESIATMLRTFAAEDSIRGEIWASVITFGLGGATLHRPLSPMTDTGWQDMVAAGRTPLGAALELVTSLVEDESVVPRRAFRPTIVLVSDGKPTDGWREQLMRLLNSGRGSRSLRLAVSVGRDMDQDDFAILEAFIGDPRIPVARADQVHELPRFFDWVTATVTTQVRSGRVNNDDLLDFMN
ncbi:VWA domain-containing protein [Catellatospora sp. NPDC049111]|uniref:vWA domain-containing protein n=1 Tax=Catellatospora sp. NPDC049111 TaxID=3155271 RepID=UPI0033E523AA